MSSLCAVHRSGSSERIIKFKPLVGGTGVKEDAAGHGEGSRKGRATPSFQLYLNALCWLCFKIKFVDRDLKSPKTRRRRTARTARTARTPSRRRQGSYHFVFK